MDSNSDTIERQHKQLLVQQLPSIQVFQMQLENQPGPSKHKSKKAYRQNWNNDPEKYRRYKNVVKGRLRVNRNRPHSDSDEQSKPNSFFGNPPKSDSEEPMKQERETKMPEGCDSMATKIHHVHATDVPWFKLYFKPCLAEFIGTSLFVFLGAMSTNGGKQLKAHIPGNTPETAVRLSTSFMNSQMLDVAVAHGIGYAGLIMAMFKISGAHFNPVVTLSVFIAGDIPLVKGLLYFLCQLLGGIAGAGMTCLTLTHNGYLFAIGGTHNLGPGVTPGQGIACEVFLTATLILVILLTTVDKETQSDLAPLAIGFVVTVGILAGGHISGASMNPARSFGTVVIATSINSSLWYYHYIYWVGPALGALISSVLYRVVFAKGPKNILIR